MPLAVGGLTKLAKNADGSYARGGITDSDVKEGVAAAGASLSGVGGVCARGERHDEGPAATLFAPPLRRHWLRIYPPNAVTPLWNCAHSCSLPVSSSNN